MNSNTYNILIAAARRDYKKLRTFPEIKNDEESERVRYIIRNIALNYRDKELLEHYDQDYESCLIESLNNYKTFKWLVHGFNIIVSSRVFSKIENKKFFIFLIERGQHPNFKNLSITGKKEYLNALDKYELKTETAIDVLEWLLNNDSELTLDSDFITKINEFGYEPPKIKKGESLHYVFEKWISLLKEDL